MESKQNIKALKRQYPVINVLFERHRWKRGGILQDPKMVVVVKEADKESMHYEAKNISRIGRSYLMIEDGSRGTRHEYACAFDASGREIARMEYPRRLDEKMFKDIFSVVEPSKVAYCAWVIITHKFSNPTQRQEEKDVSFGYQRKGVEVTVIICEKPHEQSFLELIAEADQEKKIKDEAYQHFPKEQHSFPAIHKGLKRGHVLRGFSSGGGLRVVRMESKKEKLVGYGEHPSFEEALEHLEEDYRVGHRPYNEQYGENGHTHYLTGSSQATSNIDAWLRMGHKFKCWMAAGQVIFQLKGWTESSNVPEDIIKKVIESGKAMRWINRGFTYKISPYTFPNGDKGTSHSVVKKPKSKKDPWMYEITKTAFGSNLWEAMKNAFAAEEMEVLNQG